MKKKIILVFVLTAVTAAGLLLVLNRSNETSGQVHMIEPKPDSLVSSIQQSADEIVGNHEDSKLVPRHEISEAAFNAPVTRAGSALAEVSSIIIEQALLQREISKAEIAATYSSTGDGILSEEDMRRHAEERYLKRRDLNGNGRLDGFELRAITQRGSSEGAVVDLNFNLSRER